MTREHELPAFKTVGLGDQSGWAAVVLAAGVATRLRPLSLVRAKAALPVAGTPIIGRILEWLAGAGIRQVVINLHHRPETVTRLVGDGSQWNLEVRYSWEPVVLGSAGGPRRALSLLDCDHALIVNGDTLTNCDLAALTSRHLAARALVTMAVVPGDTDRYGGVVVQNGMVRGFTRSPGSRPDADRATTVADASTVRHFIGVQAVERSVFDGVPQDRPSETVRELYPVLLRDRVDAIAAYESTAEFFDVGTARDYLQTVESIAAREGRPMDRGADCEIHPTATLARTVVWNDVTVGAEAHLRNCILADGVVVPAGTALTDAVLVAGPTGFTASPLLPAQE